MLLNFKSHQAYSTKLGIAIGQFKRVNNICNNEITSQLGNHLIRRSLLNSNYPEYVIEKAYKIAQSKKTKTTGYTLREKTMLLCISYINEKVVNLIKRQLRQLALILSPVFYTNAHFADIFIRSDLPSIQHQPTLNRHICQKVNCVRLLRDVAFLIKCENCTEENIGQYTRETSRRLKYRIKEHIST